MFAVIWLSIWTLYPVALSQQQNIPTEAPKILKSRHGAISGPTPIPGLLSGDPDIFKLLNEISNVFESKSAQEMEKQLETIDKMTHVISSRLPDSGIISPRFMNTLKPIILKSNAHPDGTIEWAQHETIEASKSPIMYNTLSKSKILKADSWSNRHKNNKHLTDKKPVTTSIPSNHSFINLANGISQNDDHREHSKLEGLPMIPFHRIRVVIPIRRLDPEDDVGMLNGMMNSMFKDVQNMLHNFVDETQISEYPPHANISVLIGPKETDTNAVNVKIKNHGLLYNIPHYDQISDNKPGLLNITWKSDSNNFNNSLFLNVTKDENGNVVLQQIQLRVLKGSQIRDYQMEKPVSLNSNGNITAVHLEKEVGLYFPNPDLLDELIVENNKERVSTQWLAVTIAGFGLIVGCFIMLMSYIIHKRNRKFVKEDNINKKPIISA